MSSLSVIYDKNMLDLEIKKGELLGQKGANKQLYLYKSCHACAVLLEIGRLREKTFRLMGLGTGKTYDLDNYDFYYDHLILWDDHEKIIIGAYRLMPCAEVLETLKSDVEPPLYTQTIFQYSETFREEYFSQTVEIGRIFIRSSHWGTSSLNYLWFGMAYYFARVPALKYFLCALSIPAEFSDAQKSVMVNFFNQQFTDGDNLATACHPYKIECEDTCFSKELAMIVSCKERFRYLHNYLAQEGKKIPPLYKNTAIFSQEGARFMSFGYDRGFSNALDGLFWANVEYINQSIATRYLE